MNSRKTSKKILAIVFCLMMLTSVIPVSALAAAANYDKDFVSETHDVFKHTESTLAPGVEQYVNYAYAKDGKQMVYYVATATSHAMMYLFKLPTLNSMKMVLWVWTS